MEIEVKNIDSEVNSVVESEMFEVSSVIDNSNDVVYPENGDNHILVGEASPEQAAEQERNFNEGNAVPEMNYDLAITSCTVKDIEMKESGMVSDPDYKKSEKNVQRLTHLPISRIKSIMKFDDDVHMATQEAIFLVTKATEMFINTFMDEVYQCTLSSKKKTISKRDVDTAIFNKHCFMFLDGALD